MKLALATLLIFLLLHQQQKQNLEDMDIIDIMMDGQRKKSVIEKNIEKNIFREPVVILVMWKSIVSAFRFPVKDHDLYLKLLLIITMKNNIPTWVIMMTIPVSREES